MYSSQKYVMTEPLIQIKSLSKFFPVREGFFSRTKKYVKAVQDVSFNIMPGQTVGLVGESGCGKTTVARLMARLLEPDHGDILLEGNNLSHLKGSSLKPYRRQFQMVFQDPYASLNPRMRVGQIVEEPLVIHKCGTATDRRNQVKELLRQVGLHEESYDRYPHEFSGGQRQRIGIARALALKPKLIIADEPVSALDVSVGAQIINLLQDLQQKEGLSYLFISHDLKMVKHLSHQIVVMYLGRVVEYGPRTLIQSPLHPYTQALVSAIPIPDPDKKRNKIFLSGEIPSPINPPSGCAFHTRCPYAEEKCRQEIPQMKEWKPSHWAACHFADKIP